MSEVNFFVPGIPKGQPRPRAFSRGGKARVYDPGTAEGWKSCIAEAARKFIPEEPISGPVSLRLMFYMPRPKKHFKGEILRADAPGVFTGKPDADNLAKAVMDALTILRFWNDDAQVFDLTSVKVYSGPRTGVAITISE